jgi:TonB family protein
MNLKVLFFLLIPFVALPSFAQDHSETTYFDSNWKKVKKKEKAVYYRITQRSPENIDKGTFSDYYMSGKIQNTGFYSSFASETKDSVWTWWYENGNKKSEHHYRNGKLEGLYTDWYTNGNKSYEVNYVDNVTIGTMRKWYENGQLKSEVTYVPASGPWVSADGKAAVYYEQGALKRESLFKNDKEVLSKCYDDKGNLVTCETPFYAIPSFVGGLPALSQYLLSNIVYPNQAYLKRIQGKVLVGFIVDKDGSILDAHIVQGVNSDLNVEALRVVRRMPKWNPGYQDGEAVKVRFVQPINFAL